MGQHTGALLHEHFESFLCLQEIARYPPDEEVQCRVFHSASRLWTLLEYPLLRVTSLLLIAMPGAPSASLLLVAMPFAPGSDALCS